MGNSGQLAISNYLLIIYFVHQIISVYLLFDDRFVQSHSNQRVLKISNTLLIFILEKSCNYMINWYETKNAENNLFHEFKLWTLVSRRK